ncbi:MAG: hypothetical protein ACRC0L_07695, partial [Angustibacter sp.]
PARTTLVSVVEAAANQARIWVEFPHPEPQAGSQAEVFRCDLTWLTSNWRCIFGQGCPGITAERPDAGCCSHGAHFTDQDDELAVAAAVAELTPDTWQEHDRGTGPGGWAQADPDAEPDEEPPHKTRVVDGACILFNGEGFPTGAGCALHHLAERTGRAPHLVKPQVCWQLPIRRGYRTVELPTGESYQEVTITEFDRRSWGPGGADFAWYCSSDSLAHTAADPLFRHAAAELIELLGAAAYAELSRRCEAHLAASAAIRAHPQGRTMLPLLVHAATLAAERESSPA